MASTRKFKFVASAKGNFTAAPTVVRTLYVLICLLAAAIAVDGITLGKAPLGLFPTSWLSILFGVFLGYITRDAGLLLLRRKSMGLALARLVSFTLIVFAVLQAVGVINGVPLVYPAINIALSGSVFALSLTKQARSHAPKAGTLKDTVRGNNRKPTKNDPLSGSWDEIKSSLSVD